MNKLKTTIRVKAPAKINLHLEILGLRDDCYHELAMVMQSISLNDILDINFLDNDEILLISNDKSLSCGEDNLIVRAANLLKTEFGINGIGAKINLTKNIPIGAGLAGGSSDAAATLIGLNSLWKLGLTNSELETVASKLGSDVPFCISGGTQLCFGRGEVLEPINNPLHSFSILLIKDPLVSVSTPWAYSKSREINQAYYLTNEKEFEKKRNQLRESKWLINSLPSIPPPLINDLQTIVAPYYSQVDKALSILSSIPGTLASSMSGSGSSCFGLYSDLDQLSNICEQYNSIIESHGFQLWSCSFVNHGPEIFYE
tara:strand:- start:8878 stop:9822 length:945 start_codon:yes stop_codon:yes gene_type:complete